MITFIKNATQLFFDWHKNRVDINPSKLLTYIKEQKEITESERMQLAAALIADDYRFARASGKQIWINAMLDLCVPVFEQGGFPLDRRILLEQLIQAELETTNHRIEREDMIVEYPEMRDFINQCFDQKNTYLLSKFRKIEEKQNVEYHDPVHGSGDEISITDGYCVENLLKSGGQKDVYKVVQKSTGQKLALKELRGRYIHNDFSRSRLKSEAVLQARLSHPNIPFVLSMGEKEGEPPVFIERLIPGTSWLEIMNSQSLEENISLLMNVSRVIAFVHEKYHIIHNDLKPDNVMLGDSGNRYNEVYVVDWGMSVFLGDPSDDDDMKGGDDSLYAS